MRPLIASLIALVFIASMSACASNTKAKNLDEAARRQALKQEVIDNSTWPPIASDKGDGSIANIFAEGEEIVQPNSSLITGGGSGIGGFGTVEDAVGGPFNPLADIRNPKQTSTVTIEPPRVEGPGRLEAKLIERVMARAQDGMVGCHEVQLYQDGAMKAGTVELEIHIAASGKVDNTTITRSTLPGDVAMCLVQLFQETDFPAPSGGDLNLKQTISFGVDTPK
jgi:hypothetical protein